VLQHVAVCRNFFPRYKNITVGAAQCSVDILLEPLCSKKAERSLYICSCLYTNIYINQYVRVYTYLYLCVCVYAYTYIPVAAAQCSADILLESLCSRDALYSSSTEHWCEFLKSQIAAHVNFDGGFKKDLFHDFSQLFRITYLLESTISWYKWFHFVGPNTSIYTCLFRIRHDSKLVSVHTSLRTAQIRGGYGQ